MSYSFNAKGNLEYRTDRLTNQKEVFAYDGMNRLTNWDLYKSDALVKQNNLQFNDAGNIASKSDLGSLYMNYGEDGKGPHALTSISGVPKNFPADDLNVTYTDFQKINTLAEGDKLYTVSYGVDDQRCKTTYTQNGILQHTHYYLGNYEEEINPIHNTTQKIHYLPGNSILIIDSEGKETLYYGYADYQGSLVALATPTSVVRNGKFAYDPWGRRRNPDNWAENDNRTTWLVNRGYTGHEHLDAFGIINMNGRVYDPLTASFFSPDPYVQAPDNWMSFNRYSYCLNNPLIYTDPDGEWAWIIPIVAGAIINWATNGADFTWEGLSYFGTGALAGASTLLTLTGVGVSVVPALAGGITGAGNNLISQGFAYGNGNTWNGSNINWGQIGISGASGAITGYVGGKLADKFTPYVSKYISNIFNGPMLQDMVTNSAVSGATGFTVGAGWTALNGGSFEESIQAGWNSAKVGFAIGGATGSYSGWQRAKEAHVNPWTGKFNVRQELQYDTKQLGRKYGEHMKDYPNMSHDDYLNMAKEIYSNPLSTKTTYPTNAPMYPGETHYQNNGNLLRIAPSGKFRSLYPYKRK